jgi:hypothetical protein
MARSAFDNGAFLRLECAKAKNSPNRMRLCSFLSAIVSAALVSFVTSDAEEVGKPIKQNEVPPPVSEWETAFPIHATIISVVPGGILCKGSVKTPETQKFLREDQPFMIFGDFANKVDGDTWKGNGYVAGRYQYTSGGQSFTTIKAWATFPMVALQKLTPAVNGPEQVRPPFNLTWGISGTRLRALLKEAKAEDITTTEKNGLQEISVHGLVSQPGVKETVFQVNENGLRRVTLVYTRPDWEESKYLAYFQQIGRVISKRFGEGTKLMPEGEDANLLDGRIWTKTATFISTKIIKPSESDSLKFEVTYALTP